MNGKYMIEVCCANIQSAIAAQKGGAKRIELVDNLYEGGTTPSYALIKNAKELLDIQVNVMIRPRGSDFLYDALEFEIMQEDILKCKDLGVDGVIFGILDAGGSVDLEKTKTLVELAWPMSTTFHRAFDVTFDPFRSLEDIIACGVERLLTAGQKNTVPEGVDLIAKLVTQSNGRIIIMPGSGINANNIKSIAEKTGVHEFHMTGKEPVESQMIFRKDGIYMGGNKSIPEYQTYQTNAENIKKALMALEL